MNFQEFYEKKKAKASWMYPFRGDYIARDVKIILQDTEEERILLKREAENLIKNYNLTILNKPETVIETLMEHFSKSENWTYIHDHLN